MAHSVQPLHTEDIVQYSYLFGFVGIQRDTACTWFRLRKGKLVSPKAGIIFGPGNSPIALFQKESALFSANSFLLYPVHSIPTKSQFSPDRVIGG